MKTKYKTHEPFITLSGWVLRGTNKGKKLSEIETDVLKWYLENLTLSKNEMYEIDAELKKRKK